VNPPRVFLDGLTPEQQRVVVLLALEVVHELAREEVYAAYERVEFAHMENEVYEAFWSLLNSQQRAVLKNISQVMK
jgi:hypothetical protein